MVENLREDSPTIALNEDSVVDFLCQRGLIPPGTPCAVESAGDGNINWVRRVRAPDGQSWIIKQAREQLEKFPQYRADTRRILIEASWIRHAATVDPDHCCPTILDFDPDQRVLVLEDLGTCPRLDHELLTTRDLTSALETIGGLLGRVHQSTQHQAVLRSKFRNEDMRQLHFAHIFELPFGDNDFPLPQPVREGAENLRDDEPLRRRITALHQQCRDEEFVLVHADPQPGNILLSAQGTKLLDAEIAHMGCAALDPGLLLGHLGLAAIALKDESSLRRRAAALWRGYSEGARDLAAWETTVQIAGVEILRRTIGAARVAAVGEVTASLTAIDTGRSWISQPAATIEELEIR